MSALRKVLRPPKTWDDLLDVPEGYVGELVAGEIIMHPRPDPPHVGAASDLGALLGSAFRFGIRGPGGWVILDEPRIRFGNDIRVPDLAGWLADRFVRPGSGPYRVSPDWICEVLSPSTARQDRAEKMPLYARHRVRHAWLLDAVAKTLEVYRLERGRWLLADTFAGDAKVHAEPFDAVELDLNDLWGPPPAPKRKPRIKKVTRP